MENEITDAELDAMEARLERCAVDVKTSTCPEALLITALRAARKKVQALEGLRLMAMIWKRDGAHHGYKCKVIEYPVCSCGVGALCELLPSYDKLDAAICEASATVYGKGSK